MQNLFPAKSGKFLHMSTTVGVPAQPSEYHNKLQQLPTTIGLWRPLYWLTRRNNHWCLVTELLHQRS